MPSIIQLAVLALVLLVGVHGTSQSSCPRCKGYGTVKRKAVKGIKMPCIHPDAGWTSCNETKTSFGHTCIVLCPACNETKVAAAAKFTRRSSSRCCEIFDQQIKMAMTIARRMKNKTLLQNILLLQTHHKDYLNSLEAKQFLLEVIQALPRSGKKAAADKIRKSLLLTTEQKIFWTLDALHISASPSSKSVDFEFDQQVNTALQTARLLKDKRSERNLQNLKRFHKDYSPEAKELLLGVIQTPGKPDSTKSNMSVMWETILARDSSSLFTKASAYEAAVRMSV